MWPFTVIFLNESTEWAPMIYFAVLEYMAISNRFIFCPPAHNLYSNISISIGKIPLVLEESTKSIFTTMISLAFIQYLVLKCLVDIFIPWLIASPEFNETMWQELFMLSYKDSVDFDKLSKSIEVPHFEFDWNPWKLAVSWLQEPISYQLYFLLMICTFFLGAIWNWRLAILWFAYYLQTRILGGVFSGFHQLCRSSIVLVAYMHLYIFFQNYISWIVLFTIIFCAQRNGLVRKLLYLFPYITNYSFTFLFILFCLEIHLFFQSFDTIWIDIPINKFLICSFNV